MYRCRMGRRDQLDSAVSFRTARFSLLISHFSCLIPRPKDFLFPTVSYLSFSIGPGSFLSSTLNTADILCIVFLPLTKFLCVSVSNYPLVVVCVFVCSSCPGLAEDERDVTLIHHGFHRESWCGQLTSFSRGCLRVFSGAATKGKSTVSACSRSGPALICLLEEIGVSCGTNGVER